jgi:hypothetical protein
MISIYNKLEQARNLLRDLRLAHPSVTLPGGSYSLPGRKLENVCMFLETELEGAMRDCVVDPSAGAAKSDGAPDGKAKENFRTDPPHRGLGRAPDEVDVLGPRGSRYQLASSDGALQDRPTLPQLDAGGTNGEENA